MLALPAMFVLPLAAAAQDQPQAPPEPCVGYEAFDDFDFWLGGWEVHIADGRKAGVNRISRQHAGCVLVEEWASSSGGSGTSLNFYDTATSEWVQIWTGSGGSQIHIRGGLVDGSMVLTGKLNYVGQDSVADFRGTWTLLEDGRVRQFFEQSSDGGDTWEPWFEGFYSRISPPD